MSEWRGLHNPDWHNPQANGRGAICRSFYCYACSEHDPCPCCLKAEVERLTAERDAQRAADLEAEISLRGRVNDLLTQLADRDRRIEAALRECAVIDRPNMFSMTVIGPLSRIQKALRGESE